MRLGAWPPGTVRRALPLAASMVVTVATAGVASLGGVASASMSGPAGRGVRPVQAAKLAVMGGPLPAAAVGRPYRYQFRVVGGRPASWSPLSGLPLGLALDPVTGVLSGVPEEAGTMPVAVSAASGGAHPAAGSARAELTVGPAADGAASIWAAGSGHPALAPLARRAADGSVAVPASAVASALYQAEYFQAVDNPEAPQPDLVNVLLADVAAQVYANNPGASAQTVNSGLAALRAAFASARNPLVPASAGKGLPSFGPTLVPQLTGALGVMATFAKGTGAGVVGPAATAVAKSVYDAYLKTSIATGIGFETGYAGFSDRSLYDVGDLTASGFHALVSRPAIEQAVACGQANNACASVEDSLLTPVIHTGLGTTAAVSVTQTPAQLQTGDPTLKTMLGSQGLKITLNSDGSLTVPAGGFDAMLTSAGNLNVGLTNTASDSLHSLFAAAGDPADRKNVSGQADADLSSLLPDFNLTLTGTLFDDGLAGRLSLNAAKSDSKPLLDGSALSQDVTTIFKLFSLGNSDDTTVTADLLGIELDIYTAQWGDAIKNLFGILASFEDPPPDEAMTLAQQTQKMIQKVFNALTDDLNQVEKSIQNVQTTLIDMFKEMEQGFAQIDFENHEILAGLVGIEFTLGQLEYQADLTDGDLVAFGQGEIQTQIKGTINRCLDLAARALAPLDFTGFTDCASQFKTEALTSASNDVVEFTTPAPPAPTSTDLTSNKTVATTLQSHGADPAANLAYLLRILHGWYGLGTDPSSLSDPVVNPGVWSEVALGYRELLDEYPQFSAGDEPDLPAIEGPGQQVAQLISALQPVDPTTFTNPSVQAVGGNYLAAFNQFTGDVAAHNANFLNAPAPGFGTPDGQHWAGYDPFGGLNQPVPSGDDQTKQLTTIPSCDGTNDPAVLSVNQNWESSVDLPKSWFVLQNLVGYANPNLQPTADPFCYTNWGDSTANEQCVRTQDDLTCTWDETISASLEVRFMGTDGQLHTIHHFDIPEQTLPCGSDNQVPFCALGDPSQDLDFWLGQVSRFGDDPSKALMRLLATLGATTQPATRDVLDSEATTILNTETAQAYKWEIAPFIDPNSEDAPTYAVDAADLTGALQLLQLLAQTIAPSVSLSNQALSDILYGQDQLPSTLTGPNNALAIFQAQQAGTGTESLSDYVSQQQGRVSELESILNGFLASAQQTAAGQAGAGQAGAARQATAPKAGDLATANAPVLTYSVLAQLATGAKLDTDSVSVTSPGALTSGLGTTVAQQLSATSTAKAPITAWSATGLPPGLAISATTGKVTGKPTKTGSFPVTVKATDTIGSTVHNSGQVTFTWTVTKQAPPVCGKQLIANGGFESGATPWSATSGVRVASAKATPAFADKWLARLGGRTAPRKDTLSQTVTIQSSCRSATLSFEMRIISNDPAAKASDTLQVRILSSTGKVLKTLATYSNKNAASKYAKFSFNLAAFKGTKITISFASNETLKKHNTSFLIDNVAIPVS
ncbi:MAG TPA: putative Ig domain-containing protein [Streptosporangiaceae bacterium]|nr:putative Ig domain-containing protein [Streptosporangiaceae bacterium]